MDDLPPNESVDKLRKAFQVLSPDSEGRVHKNRMKAFFQSTLGQLFQEDMAMRVINMMKPDDQGLISIEGFMEAFSLNCWAPETLAAMYDVLQNSPDLLFNMTDWKAILNRLGLDIGEEDVAALVQQAGHWAAHLLASQLMNQPHINQEEVGEKSSLILQALREKMNLLDIGGVGDKITSEEEAETDREADSNEAKRGQSAGQDSSPQAGEPDI